jgi:hypothetical protein
LVCSVAEAFQLIVRDAVHFIAIVTWGMRTTGRRCAPWRPGRPTRHDRQPPQAGSIYVSLMKEGAGEEFACVRTPIGISSAETLEETASIVAELIQSPAQADRAGSGGEITG